MSNCIGQAEVNSLFTYDQNTGHLMWKSAPVRSGKVGSIRAGFTRTPRKRRFVKIGIKTYSEHTLIWFLLHGDIPNGMFVDHIDRDEGNNKASNLRLLTLSENCQNRSYKGSNPAPGVYQNKLKWAARIKLPGEPSYRYLGLFSTVGEAIEVRKRAADAASSYHLTQHPLPRFRDGK